MTIRILWPTIRPQMMREQFATWVGNSKHPEDVQVQVAVNTDHERKILAHLDDVIVIGTERRGACYAVHRLCEDVQGTEGDIVIVASDDFRAGPGWDDWVREHLEGFDGALMVNDGVQRFPLITLPIMTWGCFLKLNAVVNHPSYNCFHADKELHDNLAEMGLVKDLKHLPAMFEHLHYSVGKREKDAHDEYGLTVVDPDRETYRRRKTMPLAQRLDPAIA